MLHPTNMVYTALRQRKITLHHFRKKDTLAQKSHEPPPPQGYRPECANGDLEGYWKHPAPGPWLCGVCFFFGTPSGNKLVGIPNRMSMKLVSKVQWHVGGLVPVV
eukprot:scaffold68114_cov19-Tisochrysis_lutea.AAC.1